MDKDIEITLQEAQAIYQSFSDLLVSMGEDMPKQDVRLCKSILKKFKAIFGEVVKQDPWFKEAT